MVVNISNTPKTPNALTELIIPRPRPNNIIQIVVNKQTTENGAPSKDSAQSRADLIKLTDKLAIAAKNGTLKGLGVFAEYDDGYVFGLEGSYLANPEAAIIPLKRLERRIMDQVENED